MPNHREIDLKAAINAISDVVQNRPRPLRQIDQIYMKTGDMVLQSEMVANWADNKRIAFIGDGDAISVCIAYLKQRNIFEYGPKKIVVYDLDERICEAVSDFAQKENISHLSANLYNCLDAFTDCGEYDCFYTNPPWGASNDGESVKVFTQRGMEATANQGEGIVVIADDHKREWPQQVLLNTQLFSLNQGFFIQKMTSQVHQYHLDDDPNLRSCNLYLKALPNNKRLTSSTGIFDPERTNHFYGHDKHANIQYIKKRKCINTKKTHDDYHIELRNF